MRAFHCYLPIGFVLLGALSSAQIVVTPAAPRQVVQTVSNPNQTLDRVWVVDGAGGGDFATIRAAVLSAKDGDVLLVRPGVYGGAQPIAIDKGITVASDGQGAVTITPPINIHGLTFGQNVTISGVELDQGFVIENCNGLVLLQECSTAEPAAHDVWPAVAWDEGWECNAGGSRHQVIQCRAVTMVDCIFYGADGEHGYQGAYEGYPGHHALQVDNSNVALYGCELQGGTGGHAFGGHFAVFAGAGGNGLYLLDSNSSARMTDTTTTGGPGGGWLPGSNHPNSVIDGCDGQATVTPNPSLIVSSTHPALHFAAPRILRGGNPRALIISGQPGTQVYLYTSTGLTWQPGSSFFGILHVAGSPQILSLGVLPSSGQLGWILNEPAPASVTEFESLHMQLLGVTAGNSYLGAPRQILVIDPSL